MNVTLTGVELFSIRCGINQAVQLPNVDQIIVIMDTIPAARCIFDLSTYPLQLHSIAVSHDLRVFFNRNSNNTISFWDCFSSNKWSSYLAVNKETKHFKPTLLFSANLHRNLAKKKNAIQS